MAAAAARPAARAHAFGAWALGVPAFPEHGVWFARHPRQRVGKSDALTQRPLHASTSWSSRDAGAALQRRWRHGRAEERPDPVDVCVIGAGVVGCAVARACAVAGRSVLVLEKEGVVGAGAASAGNSGIGCTGYDAPVGSMERALLRRSAALHPELFRSLGLRWHHVGWSGSGQQGCGVSAGALVVAWSDDEVAGLEHVLEANRDAGDDAVAWVGRDELHRLEPALAADAVAAVLCPREVPFDPWLLPVAYAESAMRHGAEVVVGAEVLGVSREGGLCSVAHRDPGGGGGGGGSAGADAVVTRRARVVVNCGGLHGDEVEALGEAVRDRSASAAGAPLSPSFRIAPRKGTFAVFEPPPGLLLPRHILQTAPTDHSKGVIVWVNVHGQVVVGPTAEDVSSKVDRSVDDGVLADLASHGARVVPALAECALAGAYSGLRPATEHRDYQIGRAPGSGWVTVGGIRSTGVSASAAIGEHVCAIVDHELAGDGTDPPLPALVGVSAAASNPAPLPPGVAAGNDALPPYEELRRDFAARGDGCVKLWGRAWPVTHPQTRLGLGAPHRASS